MSDHIEAPVPHRLYDERYLAALLGLSADDFYLLDHWREFNLGPKFMNLPTGQIRYLGSDITAWIEAGGDHDDPRDIFRSYEALDAKRAVKLGRKVMAQAEASE
ncbi:hypothetical protein D1823_18110 [Ruegeria sp. AD91A]|uniref:hypothetical protein n=1 Tax=Ruegeria sp. AD91A TaxID=2293862 RepID=UPI000E476EE3|nr:hypothetical protein [Ruegeria sp. AD91A]AXT28301.1 hypothetical protein D1823_18110 [Ruegeria sp. AD91A]